MMRLLVGALVVGTVGGAASPHFPSSRLPVLPSFQSDTTITVKANTSTLEFEPSELAVKAGMRVRLRFVNAGTLPHNFVLVRDEADLDTLATLAMKQGGNYVPLALKDRLIAYTLLASPGQTLEVAFVVPPPGTYTYVCLMSGHANSMLGTLRSLR